MYECSSIKKIWKSFEFWAKNWKMSQHLEVFLSEKSSAGKKFFMHSSNTCFSDQNEPYTTTKSFTPPFVWIGPSGL